MSLLGDSHVNLSQSQEKEKEQMTIDTSGMKLLESSENVNLDGSLGKMLKALLTSKTAWYSDRCKLIWKKKVSKSNVLLYQLQASVRGIKEKGSGLLPTPNTMDHIDRKGMRPSRAATNRKTGYLSEMIKMYPTPTTQDARIGINNIGGNKHRVKRGSIALADQILFPTPRSCEMEGGVVKNVEINNGSFSRKNKKGVRFGVKLKDAVHKIEKMYPTPTTNDAKNLTFPQSQKNRTSVIGNMIQQQKIKPGGKLNPNFVEFLMAYPMNWTKIEPTE